MQQASIWKHLLIFSLFDSMFRQWSIFMRVDWVQLVQFLYGKIESEENIGLMKETLNLS